MFNLDNIVRTASAAVCSLIVTAVAIGATIGPLPGSLPERVQVAAEASVAHAAEKAHG
jgi:hypothetical protein